MLKPAVDNHAAIYAAIAVLLGLAGAGFFFLPNGAAEAWPLYLAALLLPWCVAHSPHYRRPRAASLVVLAVLAWLTISVLWSGAPAAEQASQVATGVLLLAWMTGLDCLSTRREFWTGAWTVLVAVELGAAGAAFMALALGELDLPGGRMVGLMRLSNPAVAGVLWGQGAVIAAMLAWRSRHARVAYALAALALLAATLATELRSAILGFAGAAGLVMLGASRRRVPGIVVAAVLAVSVAIAFIVMAPDAPGHPRGLAGNPRWDIWRTSLAGLSGLDWWFGHGAAADQRVFLADGRVYDHAHSILLAVLVHGGVVGVALLLAAIVMAMANCLRVGGSEALLALASLAYGVAAGSFDGGLPFVRIDHSWLLLWLPMAAAIGVCRTPGKAVPSNA